MVNPVMAGFLAGGILARNSGPQAIVGGGVAFAAFSGAIDLYLRKESKEPELLESFVSRSGLSSYDLISQRFVALHLAG